MSLEATLLKKILKKEPKSFMIDPEFQKSRKPKEQQDLLLKNNISSGTAMLKHLQNIKVLLAEDNKVNVYLAQAILKKLDIDLDVAYNGKEAVEMVKKNDYDIILMDIHMPLLNGIEATEQIRNLPEKEKASIPIIALTADDIDGSTQEFIRHGMNDYQLKPFKGDELYNKMAKLLSQKEKNEQEETNTPTENEANLNPGSANDSSQQEALCNLSRLEEVAMGNKEFMGEIISIFLEQVPPELAKIQDAIHQKDFKEIKNLAHKLKSTVAMVGAEEMRIRLKEIESLAVGENMSEAVPVQIQSQLDKIMMQLEAVMSELKSFVAQ